MNRTEYVIKLLTAIQEDWPLAKGLLLLIQWGNIDDDTIDALSRIFMDAVDKVNSRVNEGKVKKWAEILQKIKRLEEWDDNTSELQELEDMIDQL
jgi:hypothetical protein